jgi:hypothetical protein
MIGETTIFITSMAKIAMDNARPEVHSRNPVPIPHSMANVVSWHRRRDRVRSGVFGRHLACSSVNIRDAMNGVQETAPKDGQMGTGRTTKPFRIEQITDGPFFERPMTEFDVSVYEELCSIKASFSHRRKAGECCLRSMRPRRPVYYTVSASTECDFLSR